MGAMPRRSDRPHRRKDGGKKGGGGGGNGEKGGKGGAERGNRRKLAHININISTISERYPWPPCDWQQPGLRSNVCSHAGWR